MPDNAALRARSCILPLAALLVVGLVLLGLGSGTARAELTASPGARPAPAGAAVLASDAITYYLYLPSLVNPNVCRPIEGATYGSLPIANWQPAERPAEAHGDLNLGLRGYSRTSAFLGLVDINGDTDPGAPQLAGLFAPARLPAFQAMDRVNDWNWGCNCRGDPITDWDVTLAEMAAAPGETIHVPNSGYRIGPDNYEVLVLYASPDRLTLKFTGEDTVVGGYAIHLENLCVDANVLSLYTSLNAAGRHELPALQAGQAVGRAKTGWVGVAIRDSGAFLDPRSRQDWWHGY